MSCSDLFLGIIAILFPPVAVWIKAGLCSVDSLINILLCMLGYIPGLIHAWYIIAKYPEPDYQPIPDSEAGERRVTYIVVDQPRGQRQPPVPQRSYGTNKPDATLPQNRPDEASGSSSRPRGDSAPPPAYSEAVAGDHKVQRPN